jgi:hypothetical protein
VTGMQLALVFAVMLVSIVGPIAPGVAHAYLDPGTGSAVLQIVIATLMGALFLTKTYWRKLVTFFRGPSTNESEPGRAAAPANDEQD